MSRPASGPGHYQRAGHGYAQRRRPDPRIAAAIIDALRDAETILNVGAGSGSYEPADRRVVAVEPSPVMIEQRPAGVPCVRAVAEFLPFGGGSFDAAMAILTLHHWTDWRRGMAELQRVAEKVVVLTHDPETSPPFWLFEYFPAILAHDRLRMPRSAEVCALTGGTVTPVPVPHDCADGFLGAHWRDPARYLDAQVRSHMSGFALLSGAELSAGLGRLEADLRSGRWQDRQGHLQSLETFDIGYRLVAGAR